MLNDALGVFRQVVEHPANRGRRARQLGRAVAFQLRGRVTGTRTLTPIGTHSKLWAELHRTGSSRVVYANPPDWPEMLVWANRLHRGDLFVDVGANVGSYSVYAAELGASIIAIEANPDLVSRLRENLAVNDIAGEVHQLALADHTGTVRFDTSGDAIGHISEQGTEVPCDTLDNVLDGRRAAGVKIDVEGAERLVLMGAAETLADHRVGCLQLEWNARSRDLLGESREPVCELLWKHGYVLHRALPTGDLVAVEGVPAEVGDIFALPRGTSRSG